MATAAIVLDTRRADKSANYPLKIRITHKGGNVSISTGVSIPAEAWESGKNGMEIKRSYPNAKTLNLELSAALVKIQQGIKMLEDSAKIGAMTAVQIKDYVLNRSVKQTERVTFISYFREFVKTRNAKRTQELYQNTLNKVVKWSNDYVMFEDITVQWLNEFHNYLKSQGNKLNTISIDERNIRAVIKFAIDEEATSIKDPFRKYKIKQQEESETMPLTIDQIKAIRDYQTKSLSLNNARDAFMASFYLIGINISDLYDLSAGSRAKYIRHKTGKMIDIELQPEVIELITKHSDDDKMFDFYRNYSNAHSFSTLINENLKTIGIAIGVPKLIMYHARHTWATLAAMIDIPEKTIAKALSHTYKNTTSRYARFDFRKVDEANRKVLDLLL